MKHNENAEQDALYAVDYILIRFSNGKTFSPEMNDLIKLVHERLQSVPLELVDFSIPSGVAMALTAYKLCDRMEGLYWAREIRHSRLLSFGDVFGFWAWNC